MNNFRKSKKAKQLAAYYYDKNNFSKALVNYIRAISFKNECTHFNEKNYHFIAYCYFALGDLDKSLLYIKECLRFSPGYIEGKLFHGEILVEMGRTEEGEKIIQECNEIEAKEKDEILDLDAFYNKK